MLVFPKRTRSPLIIWCSAALAFAAWHSLGPAAQAQASAPPKSIIVLGDSLAAGYGLDPDESFPAILQQKINEHGWNFKVLNAGVSGDTSAGGLRRLDWVLKSDSAILIVELGGNDGLRGIAPAETKKNLRQIIQRARRKAPHLEVILAGMQMPPNFGAEYTAKFKALFVDLANEEQLPLIPHLLDGVGGIAGLNQSDRIHPTANGQKIVAQNVWTVLQPILAKKSGRP